MRIQIKPQKTIDVFCQICYPVYADCAATAKVLKRRKNSMTDKLQEYAQLLINVGLNVQKDQYVVISSQVDCAYFARMCIAAAYEAGAKQVIMNWNDDFATRQYYLNAADEVFDQVHNIVTNHLDDFAKITFDVEADHKVKVEISEN